MAMKINTNSNAYIIIYSCLMVVIVAFVMAFVSSMLKPTQDVNVALDKKKQILAALNIRGLSDGQSAERYAEVVEADDIIDEQGNISEQGERGGEKTGFLLNSADYKEGRLALFVCTLDGETKYVIPVYGRGLWGAIWGYVAVNADGNTVCGAYFNHASETAGLGADIKDSQKWQEKFIGKTIYSADGQPLLKVVKASQMKDTAHEVDAITGATLTCNGVSAMLEEGFAKYRKVMTAKQTPIE